MNGQVDRYEDEIDLVCGPGQLRLSTRTKKRVGILTVKVVSTACVLHTATREVIVGSNLSNSLQHHLSILDLIPPSASQTIPATPAHSWRPD